MPAFSMFFGIEWPHGQDIAPHELYDLSVPIG